MNARFLILILILILTGCSNADNIIKTSENTENTTQLESYESEDIETETESVTETKTITEPETEPETVNSTEGDEDGGEPEAVSHLVPNEMGKVYIIMLHVFVEEYNQDINNDYRMKYTEFQELLEHLYKMHFRPVSMSDYINNTMDIPKGSMPVVLTFDDGNYTQFNLIESEEGLVINPDSALGIMERFSLEHEGFDSKATFFVHLSHGNLFSGKGSLKDRFSYLIERGYEIGNHTYSHSNLSSLMTAEEIQEQIGRNQNEMQEIIDGYNMKYLSLPYGAHPNEAFYDLLIKGDYNNKAYENSAVFKAGWQPYFSSNDIHFKNIQIDRIRAPGMNPVYGDVNWWLDKINHSEMYISDGESDIFTVRDEDMKFLNYDRIEGRKLIINANDNLSEEDKGKLIIDNIERALSSIMASAQESSNPDIYIERSFEEMEYIKSTGRMGEQYLTDVLSESEVKGLRYVLIRIILDEMMENSTTT